MSQRAASPGTTNSEPDTASREPDGGGASGGEAGERASAGEAGTGYSLLDQLLATPRGGTELAGGVRAAGAAASAKGADTGGLDGATVGICVDEHHPVLQGRVRVLWGGPAGEAGETDDVADEAVLDGRDDADAPDDAALDAALPAALPAALDAAEDATGRWIPVLRGVTVRRRDRVLLVHPAGWDEPVVVGVVDGFRRREEVPVEGGPVLELRRDEALTIRDAEGTPILRVRDQGEGPEIQLLSEASKLRLPGALDLSASEITLEARDGEVRIRANDDVVIRGEVIKLN